jgi:hypothetical protein
LSLSLGHSAERGVLLLIGGCDGALSHSPHKVIQVAQVGELDNFATASKFPVWLWGECGSVDCSATLGATVQALSDCGVFGQSVPPAVSVDDFDAKEFGPFRRRVAFAVVLKQEIKRLSPCHDIILFAFWFAQVGVFYCPKSLCGKGSGGFATVLDNEVEHFQLQQGIEDTAFCWRHGFDCGTFQEALPLLVFRAKSQVSLVTVGNVGISRIPTVLQQVQAKFIVVHGVISQGKVCYNCETAI